jgi:hypothetical protein
MYEIMIFWVVAVFWFHTEVSEEHNASSLGLTTETACSSETSIHNLKTTQLIYYENHCNNSYRREHLKSYMYEIVLLLATQTRHRGL